LAVLREGQPPSQFRFANDPKTVDGVLKKLPRGTKIAAAAKYDGPECIQLWQMTRCLAPGSCSCCEKVMSDKKLYRYTREPQKKLKNCVKRANYRKS
jgi:hypothetical protein